MNRIEVLATLTVAAVAATLSGCTNADPTRGYTQASQYRQGIKTVAVPIWRRGAGEFRRDLEIRLTQALVRRIEAETPYKVVDNARNPDTVLTGTLRSVRQQVLSFDPRTGTAREIQVLMTVDFTWTDLRTGEILVRKKNFRAAAEYIPPAPYSEDFFAGSEDVLNKLARRIVEQLAEPW